MQNKVMFFIDERGNLVSYKVVEGDLSKESRKRLNNLVTRNAHLFDAHIDAIFRPGKIVEVSPELRSTVYDDYSFTQKHNPNA